MMTFYGYDKCSTCLKAKKFLNTHGIDFKDVDITNHPPTKLILENILKSGQYELKNLFNTSGVLYREMNIKDKLPKLSDKEALILLAKNGKLVKRPIVVDEIKSTVGFKEDEFKKTWKK